jgi:asparagine synthetase B (glutamine-hydrolysing)
MCEPPFSDCRAAPLGHPGKWILRQILYNYVPRQVIERPKMGFAMPIEHWLRGPLREWAECLLPQESLRRHGLLNTEAVLKMWREHLSGTRNWQGMLWNVLVFQQWYLHAKTQLPGPSPPDGPLPGGPRADERRRVAAA